MAEYRKLLRGLYWLSLWGFVGIAVISVLVLNFVLSLFQVVIFFYEDGRSHNLRVFIVLVVMCTSILLSFIRCSNFRWCWVCEPLAG